MTQPATYHRGSQNYGTGYEMMARIDTQSAMIKVLVEALEMADAALSGANMNIAVVERKVSAALAAAKETT